MKILQITNELGYRGTPRYLANCAVIAKNAGHDVLVWGLDEDGMAADICRKNEIDVIIGESYQEKAEAFKPDIVHIHRSGGPSKRDARILRSLKNVCPCKVLETNVFGLVDFSRNQSIDLHTHISYWDLWRWRRWLWPFRQAGIALPYCIDTDAFKPTPTDFRQKHGIPADAFLIGRLGKTEWHTLKDTLRTCLSTRTNIWFATVDDYSASDNSDIPENLQARIVTLPRLNGVAELCSFYSACDVTVNFSPIGESFGYGIAESMSCGTPVIALSKPRNDNAQIELAAPEYGGFPVDGSESAADIILELESDKTRLDTARGKCRESVERRYSVTSFAPRLLSAYKLLNTSTATGNARERRFSDKGFVTDYPEREILRQLSNVHGNGISRLDMLKLRLAYSLPNALRIHLSNKRS